MDMCITTVKMITVMDDVTDADGHHRSGHTWSTQGDKEGGGAGEGGEVEGCNEGGDWVVDKRKVAE